jgi:hypothetical protein
MLNRIIDILLTPWYWVCGFFRNFVRSCKWFFVMWGNSDWDHHFLYEVMYTKLKEMEKFFSKQKNVHIIEKERIEIYEDLKLAVSLLTKIKEDDFYDCKEYDALEKKWGELKFKKAGKFSQLTREKVKTKKDKIEETKDSIKVHKLIEKRKLKVKKQFYKLLLEKIEYWWD